MQKRMPAPVLRMFLHILRGLIIGLSILFFPVAYVVAGGFEEEIKLELLVDVEAQNGRKIPKFLLTITNVSSAPARILDVRGRQDLQATYSDVKLTALGKYVEFEYSISDPGEISDNNFTILKPLEQITLTLHPTVYVGALPAGSYQAYVNYWADPLKPIIYRSPEVLFVINQ